MLKLKEIFADRNEFKSFVTTDSFKELVELSIDKEEKVILFKEDKSFDLVSSEKYDEMIDNEDSSLNKYAQFTCVGYSEEDEENTEFGDYLNNVEYIFNNIKLWK